MLTNAGGDFGFSDFCCSAPSNWDEVINGAFRRIDPDLVCHFEDDSANWLPGYGEATLTGSLLDGTEFEGTDTICVSP